MKTDDTNYMDVTMVSEYLHLAKSTIYKWVEQNYIPHNKIRKKVLFTRNKIDEWIMNNGTIVSDIPEFPRNLISNGKISLRA